MKKKARATSAEKARIVTAIANRQKNGQGISSACNDSNIAVSQYYAWRTKLAKTAMHTQAPEAKISGINMDEIKAMVANSIDRAVDKAVDGLFKRFS